MSTVLNLNPLWDWNYPTQTYVQFLSYQILYIGIVSLKQVEMCIALIFSFPIKNYVRGYYIEPKFYNSKIN